MNLKYGILKFVSVCNMFVAICQWKTTAQQNVVISNVSFWCEKYPSSLWKQQNCRPKSYFRDYLSTKCDLQL